MSSTIVSWLLTTKKITRDLEKNKKNQIISRIINGKKVRQKFPIARKTFQARKEISQEVGGEKVTQEKVQVQVQG